MAQVAEVTVSKSGEVHVDRVVCAVDTGVAVNPDTIVAQMQSGIIFGITAALWGEITLKNGRVEQSNFTDYKMQRINEAPIIEVEVVKSSADPGGIGEPGTTTLAPAVLNAVYAATGVRLRKLPDQLGAAEGIRGMQMRALPIALGSGAMIMMVGLGLSSARPETANTLRAASEFATIDDEKERAVALFNEAGKVILNPRCVNCHPAGDRPRQGDDGHPHQPLVVRGMGGFGAIGMHCTTCHGPENFDPGRVPGHPLWHLAPIEMAWVDKSLGEICEQIKDPKRNGGKSLDEIVHHMGEDSLVGWGWHPGAGRAPVPGTQQEFGALIKAWVEAGADCPPP